MVVSTRETHSTDPLTQHTHKTPVLSLPLLLHTSVEDVRESGRERERERERIVGRVEFIIIIIIIISVIIVIIR